MNPKIPRTIALLASFFVITIAFQNCGQGFEAVGDAAASLSSGGSGTSSIAPGISLPGSVFLRDPYSDANQTTIDFEFDFSNSVKSVTVSHMLNRNYLANNAIDLGQDDLFPNNIPSPTGPLNFAPSAPEFQHVMTYYHIDQLLTHLLTNKQFALGFEPLLINPHCNDEFARNNAYYDSQNNAMCLGFSDPDGLQIWSADDSDVVVHEFGHFLNHKFSTDEILFANFEMGALDEGLADVWAYFQNDDPNISEWYGRAIYTAAGAPITNYAGLRDLASTPSYPADLVGEVHVDSPHLSTLFYTLKTTHPEITPSNFTLLLKRMLESLQLGDGFGAAIRNFRTEAVKLGIGTTEINSLLQSRGLLRKDNLTPVQMPTAPRIIDNHAFEGFTVGGNCNGALDKGESVVVLADLLNSGTADLGQVSMKLTTNASENDIVIQPGLNVASLYRLRAGQSYVASEIQSQAPDSNDYFTRLYYGAFVVEAKANAAGTYNFTLTVSGMNTVDNTPVTKAINFSIAVGAVPTRATPCPGNQEQEVMP